MVLGVLGFGLAVLAGQPAIALEGAVHPRLVSAESARCGVCHEELLEGRASIHPPVAEDCTTCHEFEITSEGTRVALLEPEPGLCVTCHDEFSAAVDLELETPHFPVADSCLNCHDPHAGVAAKLLAAPTTEVCGECHDLEDLNERHDGQLTETTRCATCHQIHGSDNPRMLASARLHPPFEEGSCQGCHREPVGGRVRLRARGERLCEACHGDKAEEAGESGSVHAALQGERGRAGCLSCHSPHMSDQRALLLKAGPALCGQCHGQVLAAAEAETGHFAAADDCTNCHRPHASENRRLLALPLEELCGECHDLADEELIASHLGADLEELTCVNCHTPHGAGHPKLLATHLHPPVEDGCDICHEGSFDQLAEGGPPELCVFCHDEIAEQAEEAEVPHAALEFGTCTDCHNPHASAQEKLVKSPGAGPCVDCHDEKLAGSGEFQHGAIQLLGCRACHEPHGGSRERLLRAEDPELCLGCHAGRSRTTEDSTVRLLDHFDVPAAKVASMATLRLDADGQKGHPVSGHRVLGAPTEAELRRVDTTFRGELRCMTCHDPHKGASPQLFQWGATVTREACQACHPK